MELLCIVLVISSMMGVVGVVLSSDSWQRSEAEYEARRLTRWLTNRYWQSIMYTRPFFLTVGRTNNKLILLTWLDPVEKEKFQVQECYACRLGSGMLAMYQPLYRTLTPGMTIEIRSDMVAAPWGKIVLPVKGYPYLEWYAH
ncbi:MAG: hypothetical protein CSA35_06780 [Dethiosulfovibrio peptidovorans]|nr:MAG: hypothetical protein CSA35_06780 [Dethiosulfovibrio peptidovorans]